MDALSIKMGTPLFYRITQVGTMYLKTAHQQNSVSTLPREPVSSRENISI